MRCVSPEGSGRRSMTKSARPRERPQVRELAVATSKPLWLPRAVSRQRTSSTLPRRHAAAALQFGDDGVDGDDLLRSFRAGHDDAVETGPHGGGEIGEHQLGVDLNEHLRTGGLGGNQAIAQGLAGRRFIRFGHEFRQVQHDHVGAGRGGVRYAIRMRNRSQQPGTSDCGERCHGGYQCLIWE